MPEPASRLRRHGEGVMRWELEVPIPPSTNQLYRNVSRKGRVKTTKYKAWLKEALWVIKAGIPVLEPPVQVGVTIYGGKGFSVQSDISNRVKALEDALVETGRIPDDNVQFVTECRQRYFSGNERARCVLTVVDSREGEE